MPSDAFAPRQETDGRVLFDRATLAELSQRSQRVLVWLCTSASAEEHAIIRKAMPQLLSLHLENVCTFVLQPLPAKIQGAEQIDVFVKQREAMVSIGIDDMLVVPYGRPDAVLRAIRLAQAAWELSVRRFQSLFDDLAGEGGSADPRQLQKVRRQHHELLWESIPRNLVPGFPPVDNSIRETSTQVGIYQVVVKLPTVSRSTVLQVIDPRDQKYVMKVIEKSTVNMPNDLQRIYREFELLSREHGHPNIVRCLSMMHTDSRAYLIFEFAGRYNLSQWVSALPGYRLDAEEPLGFARQLSSALAYCHRLHLSHMSVSLEHIVLMEEPATATAQQGPSASRYRYQLVDFSCAVVGDALCNIEQGTLPCIAPEVALGEPYVPHLADCWSAGIVLAEAAGGLSSVQCCVAYDAREGVGKAARMIREALGKTGVHQRLLSYMSGNAPNPAILNIALRLLKVIPAERAEMHTLFGCKLNASASGEELA